MKLKENQTIVFEGDSITKRTVKPYCGTWPYLRLMNWNSTWADEFEEMLFCWCADLKLTTINSAIGGSNIRDLLERMDSTVIPYNPDWLALTIGNNDVAMGISIDDFEKMLREYIAKLPNTKIVFLGGFKGGVNTPDEAKELVKRIPYYEKLEQVAKETGNFYLDVGTPLYDASKSLCDQYEGHTAFGDGIHLNRVGSLIVAKELIKFFEIF